MAAASWCSGAGSGVISCVGATSEALSGSDPRLRWREMDSPGSRPLPSHSMGVSISVEGLEKPEGRTGAGGSA